MDIYIDYRNLKSFINARHNDQYRDCYEDCYRLLQRQLTIKYNFEKPIFKEDDGSPINENDENNDDTEIIKFLHDFITDGRGWNEDTIDNFLPQKFPTRPIKSNSANQFNAEQHSAVYLLDDERINVLQEKGNILVGQLGQEIEILKQLFCGKDYDFHKLYNIQDQNSFPNWQQIAKDKLNLPLSDIIIMDRYIGSQDRFINTQNNGTDSQEKYTKYNIYKLIDTLIENVNGKINVVIFCNKVYFDDKGVETFPNWESFKEEIEKRLENKTNKKGSVTIVFFPRYTDYEKKEEKKSNPHDRVIFTNYMLLRSGDSFCYYDDKGKVISNGASLDIDSLAKKENYDFAMAFIQKAQEKYNEVKNKNNPDLILMDKDSVSNYITF